MEKKTIFITINRAIIVRNILLNSAFSDFAKKYRIVFITPQKNHDELRQKFPEFEIETLFERSLTPFRQWLEQLFISLHKSLIYNPTIQIRSEYGILARKPVRFKWLRNKIEKYIFGRFLSHAPIRNFFKKIDAAIFSTNKYDSLIAQYQPDLVFITAMGADDEIAFLRNCKKQGVKSVGMAMSWDNLSKFGLREKTDYFMVWSQYMKEEALHFQDYAAHQLEIVGIPQFDEYRAEPIMTREEFYTKFHLDPKKKTLFFGSEGPVCPDDPYIVSFLKEKIIDGTLSGYQILVRPHFSYPMDLSRFEPLKDEIVAIDTYFETSHFKDGTALSLSMIRNLIAEIRYCDVHVTSTSTLVLDILAGGKLPLLYNFDKEKNTPMKDSIKRLYKTLWFREIFKFDLNNTADNEEELVQKINEFSTRPDQYIEKRNAMVARFCYRLDGKSGERLFKKLSEYIIS